jgi:uncharacterized protein YacL
LRRKRKLLWPISWSALVLGAAWVCKPTNFNRYFWFIPVFILAISWIFHYLLKSFLSGWFSRLSIQEIIIKAAALLNGLGLAALLVVIFGPLIGTLDIIRRSVLILSLLFFCSGLFMFVASIKIRELVELFFNSNQCAEPKKISAGKDLLKILDTSAIIDGRIADLCKTGFLEGVLIIPHFVLNELQKIADSSDPLRRNRGRRGLDILNKIQKENQVAVRIFDIDYEDLAEVDTKLLRLARELEAKVVTNDFNLNKVAELYGVEVLNINDLSNAIKPVVLPGEEMMVHVLRDGKEYGQGIGYLEDGTMIVVEGGKNYIGLNTEIIVTSVLQTSAGRMIFAKPKDYLVSKVTSL